MAQEKEKSDTPGWLASRRQAKPASTSGRASRGGWNACPKRFASKLAYVAIRAG
ncbi:MAG: hypothetical protein AAB547_01310 [Patescibacteria group bacterium]